MNSGKKISFATAILASLWYVRAITNKSLQAHPYLKLLCSDRKPGTHRSTIFRLNKAGLVKKRNDKIELTEKGIPEALFAFIDAESCLFKNNFFQKWDKAWRIIFFDIPENKRRYRDYLRNTLKKVGFKEMQRSIWVYPYTVPSFLKELLFNQNIKTHVRFITTDNLENDADLRKTFNLS